MTSSLERLLILKGLDIRGRYACVVIVNLNEFNRLDLDSEGW